ncbi:hypothetical protein [Sorangium sp. So ce131]|uniref:hypothetical protein n=1 Tax=Sorangium sp. So ce131 TaxID=3133282 RepID=UPI003F5F8E9B
MDDQATWDIDEWLISVLEDPKTYDGDITQLTLIKLKDGPAYVGDHVSHTDTEIVIKLTGTSASVSFDRAKVEYVDMYDDDTGYMMEVELE